MGSAISTFWLSIILLLFPMVGMASNTNEACVDRCDKQSDEELFRQCAAACYDEPPPVVVDNVPLPVPRPDNLGLPRTAPTPTPRPTNNGQNNNSSGGGSACQSQYDRLKSQCDAEIESTASTCDEKNDSGLNSVSGTASQMALQMGQQTSSNVQAACSGMADVSQAANAALAAYRLNCSNALSSCRKSCQELVDYAKNNESCLGGATPKTVAEDKLRTCSNYVAKVNEANQALRNYGQTNANASQCEKQTKGDETKPKDPITEMCKATPNYPGCPGAAPVDCSNAEFARTNKVCVCINSPMDPMCSNQQKAGGESQVTNLIDSSSRVQTAGGADDISGDIPGLPGIQHAPLPPGGGGEGIDGQQGSGVHFDTAGGGGSGGLGSGRSASSAEGATDDNVAVNGGTYGGSGGSGNAGAYGGGGGDGSSYRAVAGSPGKGGAANPKGPDLRQFLPGGKLDPRLRGVAGAQGVDGITGPHSDIWQKIQNRYRVISPSLLVP